jgi:hypothetical protein
MPITANITVYLQALGAHFLGKNAFDIKNIKIKMKYSGGEISIPYTLEANSNDGTPSPAFIVGISSFMPIITVGNPTSAIVNNNTVTFLNTDANTIAGKKSFLLPANNELATITVSIPITSVATPLILTQQLLLAPKILIYKTTIVVPGLYVTPVAMQGSVAAFVKMMCGCPVTMEPPTSLWLSTDFKVTAQVLDINNTITPHLLSYQNPQATNSLFSAPLLPNQKAIQSITFFAQQLSTGNYSSVFQSS